MTQVSAACSCGAARCALPAAPLFRILCHCTTCQRYNRADHADVAFYRAIDVDVIDEASVAFEALQDPPRAERGRCTACDRAAWERIGLPGLALIGVPVGNVSTGSSLPDPVAHIFYDTRTGEPEDSLPRYSSALGSNLAWLRALLGGLWARKRRN